MIVPVYNMESFLSRCLDSIAAQTWPDMEVIVVDDASTDESGRICDAHGRLNEKRCTVLSALDQICEDVAVSCPQVEMAFRQVALDAGIRLAMQAVEEGMEQEKRMEYLKRFQKHVKHHFSWKALRMAPDAKSIAAELLLAGNRAAFSKAAVLYQYLSRSCYSRKKDADTQ